MKAVTKDIEIFNENDFLKNVIIGRPYQPDNTVILLLKEGSMEVNYDLTNYILTASTVLLISSKKVYEFIKITPNIEVRVLLINPASDILTSVKINKYETFFKSTLQCHYTILFPDFLELWNSTEILNTRLKLEKKLLVDKEIIHHQLLSTVYLIADLTQKYNTLRFTELNRGNKLTHEFIKLLKIHSRKEKNVSYYANLMHISSKYLSETIKESTGFTAGQIISQAVVTDAKILLSNPQATVKKVAHDLNFSDQYSFSKFFKKLTMLSSSDFSKKATGVL